MDFTNFWFPKKAQDGEYTIDQSLRFRNNGSATSYLENSSLNFLGDQTYTLSYWLKKATGSNQNLMNIDPFNNDTSAGGTPGAGVHHSANGGLSMYSGSGFARGYPGEPLFRDHSAWYHFVHSRDATGWQTWVNGVSLGTVEVSDLDGAGGTKIMNPWGGGQAQYGAYLADYYCIDGQYLSPTVFGEYNEVGVWAPIEPNFSKGVSRYSDDVTTDTGSYYSSTTGPEKMFDGQFGGTDPHYTQSDSSSGSSWIEWKPATPVPYTSSVEVYCGGPTVNFNDGPDQTVPPTTWTEVASGSGEISKIRFTGGYGGTVHAIRVDGVILTDPYLWSSYLTVPSGFNASYPATQGFDGSTSLLCQANNGGEVITFAPDTDIEFTTSLRIFQEGSGGYAIWNGNTSNGVPPGGGWGVIYEGAGTINATYPITVYPTGDGSNAPADFYAIEVDGKILVNGANPSFGANGFHLDFSDPNDVGADRSGNGNHFTASGIDTSLVANGYWVDDTCTFSNGTIPNSQGQPYIIDADPANGPVGYSCPSNSFTGLFDGKLDTNGMYWPSVPETGGNEFTFDLRDYDTIESFDFYTYNWSPSGIPDHRVEFLDSNKVAIPGTERSTGGLTTEPQAMDWRSMTVLGDPKYIRFFRTGTSDHLQMRAFRINGAILDQSGVADITYDVMLDSPTQNWSTQNPILALPEATWSAPVSTNANLLVTGNTTSTGQDEFFNSSIGIPQGTDVTYYAEFITQDPGGTTNPNYPVVAIKYSNKDSSDWIFYLRCDGTALAEGSAIASGPSFANVNDVVGITWNASTGTVNVAVNGGAATTWNLNPAEEISFITTSNLDNAGNSGNSSSSCNYGQQPFLYQPAGTVALQTQNMPKPAILNGRDHFQALTGPGPETTITGITTLSASNYTISYHLGTDGDGSDPNNSGYSLEMSSPRPSGVSSVGNDPALLQAAQRINEAMSNPAAGYQGMVSGNHTSVGTQMSSRIVFNPPIPGPITFQSSSQRGVNDPGFQINDQAQDCSPALDATPRTFNDDVTSVVVASQSANWNTWFRIRTIDGGTVDGGFIGTRYEITVADASKFSVGNYISNTNGEYGVIESINGNVIVVEAGHTEMSGWVVGSTLQLNQTILEQAQTTFPDGLWWIKDRENANQHQFVDSARGGNFALPCPTVASESSYVAPAGQSIAWCWKAGTNTVTDNLGTIESQVCVNEKAGFSIVQWVGDGAFGSVGHGLGKRPGLVITRSRQGDHWIVGMDGITELSAGGPPEAWVNPESFVTTNWQNGFIMNDAGPQSNYVASSGINVSGNTMLAYVWAPIPGYSAFGTYIGHNNSDAVDNGEFVYCGFRPAFVLTKCVTAGSDWIVVDSTRDITNPALQYLRVNQLDQDSTMTGGIDLLSNGFKIQQGGSFIGDAGQTYLYWAFAENPFQSPTAAR